MTDEKIDEISTLMEQSTAGVKAISEEAYKLIITKTKEGFFQEHQTPAKLKALAKDILSNSGFKE